MKLVFAIVHDEDEIEVMKALNKENFGVTKLCSSGGFLRAGNTTLLVGVETERVDAVIELIKKKSKSRKKLINSTSSPAMNMAAATGGYPVEIKLGGATIFVVNVSRFEKV